MATETLTTGLVTLLFIIQTVLLCCVYAYAVSFILAELAYVIGSQYGTKLDLNVVKTAT